VDNLRVEQLEEVPPLGETTISSVARSGANVIIEIAGPVGMQNPVVEGAENVAGPYAAEQDAQVENLSPGPGASTWRATIPVTTTTRFFRIRGP
jgi:hypothetical protein